MPSELRKQAVVPSIDDTMAEKSGEKFEYCSKLFDHAAHNGSNYLNGHCFVSLLLSVLTSDHSYLSIPVACRMWTKVKNKLEMAAELVRDAMSVFDPEQPVVLCCGSWYLKGEILKLVQEFQNLTLICNVRSDTVLYDLPPKRTVKRGRPRIWGKRLSLQDFELKAIPGTDYLAGSRPVMTRLLGHRVVYAIVTKTKKGSSYRVSLCTSDPASISFNPDFVENSTAAAYAKADPSLLPLTIYSLRWKIEVSYYEQKIFWGFEDYMLRSHNGIKRLLNLLGILYALMKLLPFLSEDFSALKSPSAQQTRFVLSSRVRQQVFCPLSRPGSNLIIFLFLSNPPYINCFLSNSMLLKTWKLVLGHLRMIFCAKWKNFWFRFIRVRHCLKIIRTPTGRPFSAMLCKKFLKSTNTIHNSRLFSIFRGCFEVYPLSRTTLIFRGVRRYPVWYTDRALPIWRIVQHWGATRAPGRVCGRQCAIHCLFF